MSLINPKRPPKRTIVLVRNESKYAQKFALLKDDIAFQNDIVELRQKLGIDLDKPGILEYDKNSLGSFLKKHHLTKDWEPLIRGFLRSGVFEAMDDPHGIRIDIDQKKHFASIRVYPETTLQELKGAYKYIVREFKDGRIIKTTPAKNADRDAFIYKLRSQGKSYKEIKTKVYENYDENMDSGHLSRVVDKMKNRRAGL